MIYIVLGSIIAVLTILLVIFIILYISKDTKIEVVYPTLTPTTLTPTILTPTTVSPLYIKKHLKIFYNEKTSVYPLFNTSGDDSPTLMISEDGLTVTETIINGESPRWTVLSPTYTSEEDWQLFDILGKSISFDVDISKVPCGYNYNLYTTTQRPGQDYCDGQMSCTEIDLFEGNQSSWHTTLHYCISEWESGKNYPIVCDHWGNAIGYGGSINTLADKDNYLFVDASGKQTDQDKLYGPGEEFTINTLKPFHADIDFPVDSYGDLIDCVVRLSQDKSLIYQNYKPPNDCVSDTTNTYYKRLTVELKKGNTLISSLWSSDDMAWLDSPPCPKVSSFTDNVSASFSNIQIKEIN